MRDRPLTWLNSFVTAPPNSQPAPRGDTRQVSMSSGSLHIKSVSPQVMNVQMQC